MRLPLTHCQGTGSGFSFFLLHSYFYIFSFLQAVVDVSHYKVDDHPIIIDRTSLLGVAWSERVVLSPDSRQSCIVHPIERAPSASRFTAFHESCIVHPIERAPSASRRFMNLVLIFRVAQQFVSRISQRATAVTRPAHLHAAIPNSIRANALGLSNTNKIHFIQLQGSTCAGAWSNRFYE